MDTLKLPFQIGMEYENWEFKLDVLPDRIKGYDSYKYIGKEFKIFLNYLPDETELIFNLDILECVLFIFKDRTEQFLEELKFEISNIPNVYYIYFKNIVFLFYCESCIVSKVKHLIYCSE